RPRSSPTQISPEWQNLVVELRRLRMTGAAIAKKLRIPRSTVARILKRHGLERLKKLDPPVRVQRYEKTRPGELIHLDIKKLGRVKGIGHRITGQRTAHRRTRGIGWEFVHVCIDDFTRLAYVEVLEDEKGSTAVGFLERAAAWFAEQGVIVERVMTDNGSCYRSKDFAAAVVGLGAKHSKTRPYTPRTNGKAERFIQTLMREWAYARPFTTSYQRRAALPAWLRRYNERRPHAGIGGASPITRLRSAA
ncbi:MAG TPA: IS481 family transposase, partial [Anaeromyxobacteraceae bacterium]|nr:IS481 family transposase [Anaeromyxobacteraceae bacterium]